MKLCITANENSLDAQTESSFGRAHWLIFVDTAGSSDAEIVENRGVNASQGAGIAAAQIIADKSATALLTGRVGPKAQAALQAAGIQIYENIAQCTVSEALEQFRKGKYQMSNGPAEYGAGCGPGKGRGGGGGGRGNRGQGQGRRGGR